jgi:type IV fimbrial biogenesis protein FimT
MFKRNTNYAKRNKRQSTLKIARKSLGFTLMELMITLAIVAILVGIAVPNFKFQIEQARFTSTSNEIVTALNYARGEAVRRSRPVSVSRVGTTWQDGWTAFIDPTRAGVLGALPVLRAGNGVSYQIDSSLPAPSKKYAVDITGAPPFVLFDSNGRRRSNVADAFVSFEVFKTDAEISSKRTVCVSQSGRIFVTKGAAACV